ncbi:MAG: A/G-specific adenine glycosylase [Planctomycetia bacterium]|nr:A/G-specific adenine glycosylase [Planctomycetia bacterium]
MTRRDDGRRRSPGPDARPVQRALLAWYRRTARDLPWRRDPEPYRVWVSETMLQQTQVDRVQEAFGRFLGRFPTVAALAAADADAVLRAWEGLGYYRRARQLHAAARLVVAEHDGRVPEDESALRRLPGIGRYTAHAILSIALDRPVPIVEANSRRVLARLVGHDKPVGGSGDEPLWRVAADLVPRRGAGAFNQALMDLGATVCTPRQPRCPRCPLRDLCVARAADRTTTIPVMAAGRKTVARRETALVVWHRDRVLLERRGSGEWWEGLWDFPRLPAADLVRGLTLSPRRSVGRFPYTVTHHRIDLRVVSCHAARAGRQPAGRAWVTPAELDRLALSSPGRRIARLLASSAADGPG